MRAVPILLALAAMLLMPLGMSAASAAPSHRAPIAMAGMGHCGDSAPDRSPASAHSDCAVGCTMIAAADARMAVPLPMASLPAARPAAATFSGIDPETATPPPKQA